MEDWNLLIDKFIKIVFEDGENHFSQKRGILKSVSETHLFLEVDKKIQTINLSKILRTEEARDGY